MILEAAVLNVIPEKTTEFEAAFGYAQDMISTIKGFNGLQLQRSLEVKNRYILLAMWEKSEDLTIGFRNSDA